MKNLGIALSTLTLVLTLSASAFANNGNGPSNLKSGRVQDKFSRSAMEETTRLVTGDGLDTMEIVSYLHGFKNGRQTIGVTVESRNSICTLSYSENRVGKAVLKSIRCN